MKRILMAVLVLCALCVPVLADVDIGYTGPIDPYTGDATESGTTERDNLLYVTDNISYDVQRARYLYSVDGIAQEITATVMDGMITTQTVMIEVPTGITAELYRDGIPDDQVMDNIREPGDYSLSVASPTLGVTSVLRFTIVNDHTGITSYRMPKEFLVMELSVNGEESEFDRTVVDFSQEGEYAMRYICYPTKVSYSLYLTVDHTPPELTIEGVDEKGTARNEVNVTPSEDVETVKLYFNGEEQRFTPTLTKTGYYEITATDEAGNSTTAAFTIMLYLNTTGMVFLAILALLIIILLIYLLRSRRKIRVR